MGNIESRKEARYKNHVQNKIMSPVKHVRPKQRKYNISPKHDTKIQTTLYNNMIKLIYNFIISQNLKLKPRTLKKIIICNYVNININNKTITNININGRVVTIIFFECPEFCNYTNVVSHTNFVSHTTQRIEKCSYICAFDFETHEILDVMCFKGNIINHVLYREFAAVLYSPYSLGPVKCDVIYISADDFKFKHIMRQCPMNNEHINYIDLHYIQLNPNVLHPATDVKGKLIIYCYESRGTKADMLFTVHYFAEQRNWIISSNITLPHGMRIDITKYTCTDFIVSYCMKQIDRTDPIFTYYDENSKLIYNFVALHITQPNLENIVSEICSDQYKSLPNICEQNKNVFEYLYNIDYNLSDSGQLSFVKYDNNLLPLKYSAEHGLNQDVFKICNKYNYKNDRKGTEILYYVSYLEDPNDVDELHIYGHTIICKNNIHEYTIKPGNILKYACLQNMLNYNTYYIYNYSEHVECAIINNDKPSWKNVIYSPDGKYLAFIINTVKYAVLGNMCGILLYARTERTQTQADKNDIWHEISYINMPYLYNIYGVNFIEVTDNHCDIIGYNLCIFAGKTRADSNHIIINFGEILCQKYFDLLSLINTQLGYNNIKNIAQFITNIKTKYIQLHSKNSIYMYKKKYNKKNYIDTKHIHNIKLNI